VAMCELDCAKCEAFLASKEMNLIKTKAKEIFTKTKLPGCAWVLNQYVGCEHACNYCYAKFIAKWKPTDYGKWGTWVEAKINAPELICNRKVKGDVFMSSISDPYQPIEKDLKLTRRILENLDKETNLSILTKSDLVVRDIDILKKFKNLAVGLTINSFSGKIKEIFEPNSPSNEKRIEALQKLKQDSIATYAFVSPIIPGLIDLEDIVNKTKSFVDYYWFEFLNLRGAGKEFAEILKKEFPASYKIVSDSELYKKFIEQSTKTIKGLGIKVRGIVKH